MRACVSLRFAVPSLCVLACIIGSARSAVAGWPDNGLPIAIAPKNQIYPVVVPDAAGGAIVVWQDSRTPPGPVYYFDVYAQRITASGNALWTNNGAPVCTLPTSDTHVVAIPDGFGGAIIAWQQTLSQTGFHLWDIYAQRINSAGNPVWPANGIKLNTQEGFQSNPCLASDGSGGAIVAWYDNGDIWARRISDTGASPWPSGAIAVCNKPFFQQEPGITCDEAGGAIICWSDSADVATRPDIYAQHVNSAGVLLWPANGLPICTAAGTQYTPVPIDDGFGGAVVMWDDSRGVAAPDIFMQRVDPSGFRLWANNGIPLSDGINYQGAPVCLRSGQRIFATWVDTRVDPYGDVYAQQIDLNGHAYWADDGIPVIAAIYNQHTPQIAADGLGGALIAWSDSRTLDTNIRAQRVNSAGQLLWDPNGMVVVDALQSQVAGPMASGSGGNAFIAWWDARDGDPDVYAAMLSSNGPTVTALGPAPSRTPLLARPPYPNPFSADTHVEVNLPVTSDVTVEVFNVNGECPRRLLLSSRPAGWNGIDVSARDDRGRRLPSGVYFLKVSAAGSSVTQRMVIAH